MLVLQFELPDWAQLNNEQKWEHLKKEENHKL